MRYGIKPCAILLRRNALSNGLAASIRSISLVVEHFQNPPATLWPGSNVSAAGKRNVHRIECTPDKRSDYYHR